MKKSTIILLVFLGLVVIGGIIYFLWSSPVSADVDAKEYGVKKIRNIDLVLQKMGFKSNLDKIANGIKPKILSNQDLTLQQVATNQYQILEPVKAGEGFGIQLALPTGLTPKDEAKWVRTGDVGVVILDKTYKKIAVYPIGSGAHKISCQIGGQTIDISFSDQGFASATTTVTATSTSTKGNKSTTATPTSTTTSSATTTSTVSAPVVP